MIQKVLVVRREYLAKALTHVQPEDLQGLAASLKEIYTHISE